MRTTISKFRSILPTMGKLSHLITLIIVLNTFMTMAWPVLRNSKPEANRRKRLDPQRYLMQYGYLPMSDMETGNLRTEKQLKDAIRVMQRFGHIPQTGEMDAATRNLMKKRRCSLPDVSPDDSRYYPDIRDNLIHSRQKRYVKQGSKWKTTNLTWGVNSYPEKIRDKTGNPKDLSQWEIQREFRLATQVWSSVSRLDFRELDTDPKAADIVIEFKSGYHGDGYPFDGPGRTLAHAFYPGKGIGGDMHFDISEPWVQHKDANNTYEEISLFVTAAHELGHSLGLYHSDVEGALMSPYLITYPPDFRLPMDDTRAIQELYGIARDWQPATDDSPHPEDNPSVTHPSTPSRPRPPSGNPEKPITCDTDYDAISIIRREIYVFKGKYFWRIDGKGQPRPNYPAEIVRFWQMLPRNLTKIDAVYERPQDGNIVFFIGKRYYICHGNNELRETGPLRNFGLPNDLANLDAAFIWGHNGRTYFFADTMYWRFEEDIAHVELDYPRDMVMWRGVPYNIDSAFKYNGTTFFFKGRVFYEFDDLRMKVTRKSPFASAPYWFNCPVKFENPYFTGLSSDLVSSNGQRSRPLLQHPWALYLVVGLLSVTKYLQY